MEDKNPCLGTILENLASTSLTNKIIGCSIICTSLNKSILRIALPSPIRIGLGWRNAFRTLDCEQAHI